ncbi:hypothetical protein EDC96DRAFT_567987 [Choanephora cucurbitarum]|nr:hypothetical protein EDC96DRAFT_567987 [Choanephora cucurbitarum]
MLQLTQVLKYKSFDNFVIDHSVQYLYCLQGTVSNKNSVVKAIVNVIPSEEYEESILDYYSMKETFSMYFVDFKSIRARRSRFRRKLDQLSSRLLCIGFGPE